VRWPRITERAQRTRAWIVCEDEADTILTPPIRGTREGRGRRVVLHRSYVHRRKVSMAAFACYLAGRLPRLFYALVPDASFTEDEFDPLLTDLHDRLGGQKVILVRDRLTAHVRSRKTNAFIAAGSSWLILDAARVRPRAQPGRTILGVDQERAAGELTS
jgi:hypothetical protein